MSPLALDIGNTCIKWMINGQAYTASQDEFAKIFPHSIRETIPEYIIICSVAEQSVTQTVVDTLSLHLPEVSITFFTSTLRLKKFTHCYAQSEQLGPDRWAACIGARQFFSEGTLLVASFGTATTIDLMSADNCFLGGVILPGLEMMARALSQGTARLPTVNLNSAGCAIPSDTQSAIAEGIVRAQLGALELSRQQAEFALGTPVSLVATGGALGYLKGRLPAQTRIVQHLVLHGLFSLIKDWE
jgi:type III pantothenate kinase